MDAPQDQEPRGYETKWIEQLMPQFDLADEDIKALRAFLASRTEGKVPAKYRYNGKGEQKVVEGRRLVARYNCTGCHIIEGAAATSAASSRSSRRSAPPNLLGEGKKVQSDWLFGFIKAPVPIRPWLKVRMPTFGLNERETTKVVEYFARSTRRKSVRASRAGSLAQPSIEAGKLLMTRDYFDCFSCHQRGAEKPQGPPEGWAPDLAMAARASTPSGSSSGSMTRRS